MTFDPENTFARDTESPSYCEQGERYPHIIRYATGAVVDRDKHRIRGDARHVHVDAHLDAAVPRLLLAYDRMRSLCKQSVGERNLREAHILVATCEERDVIAVRAYLGPADFYYVPAVPVFVMGYGIPTSPSLLYMSRWHAPRQFGMIAGSGS